MYGNISLFAESSLTGKFSKKIHIEADVKYSLCLVHVCRVV